MVKASRAAVDEDGVSAPSASPQADASALAALVDAAAGILAADSLAETLGRIAHHLRELVAYDELSVYEVDRTGTMLVPVYARGLYADEVLADVFPVTEGVTGWVVTNRRTRNVERSDREPLAAVVQGTLMEPESFVSVPLLVEDRVVGALNVYRIGEDKAFEEAEVAQVERFATMAALAFDSARQRDSLREQARTDGLTGLLNHRACHERLREEVARAAELERPLAVVALDLDHFKAINDAYGHGEGDKVLGAVAERLRGVVREHDVVARLGGEEFALILPGVDGEQGREAAERARAAIAEVTVGGRPLSCSAGVAAFPADDARSRPAARARRRRALLGQAVRPRPDPPLRPPPRRPALGRRPARGDRGPAGRRERDRAGVPAGARARHGPRRRLRGARAHARRARPAAPTSGSTRRTGAGSGRRWRRPPCGPPCACRTGPSTPSSPSTSARPGWSAPRCARRCPDDLRGVIIELTEHALFAADDALDHELAALRARGARIALDDAGNGYAGLQEIIRIAPDVLKLDRSLVDGVHADPVRFALLEALIAFAATSWSAVCAEGVEDLEDLAVLAQMDVAYAQGWVLGPPAGPWPAVAAGGRRRDVGRACARACASPRAVADGGPPTLGRLAAELADVASTDEMARVAHLIAPVMGADEATVSRLAGAGGPHPGREPARLVARRARSTRCATTRPPPTSCARARRGRSWSATRRATPPRSTLLCAGRVRGRACSCRSCSAGATSGCWSSSAAAPVPFSAGEIDRALLIAHQLGGVLDLLERARARRTR